jgi:non-canonical purine NTP pyrophosphatase (RdgB/HAM1 family)
LNVTYVTGNPRKAAYFSKLIGREVPHQHVNVPEIQSLSLREVVTEKAKAAYAEVGAPVIVEDTMLMIHCMGQLPGTFIRWFLEEMSLEAICRLADADPQRRATAAATFAYYDGKKVVLFEGGKKGCIAAHPKGDEGFGWNPLFIPDGETLTLGEMDAERFERNYQVIKNFGAVKEFLDKLEA